MGEVIHPLKAWRTRAGKSLDDVASDAGTTRSWLSRIENGEVPSNKLLRRLLKATNNELTADDFLKSEAAA